MTDNPSAPPTGASPAVPPAAPVPPPPAGGRPAPRLDRAFRRDLWALIRPYWVSEERWSARGLLAVIIAMNLGMVFISVRFNDWYGRFYNALEEKNVEVFWREMWIFSLLATIFIIVAVYRLYLNQLLQIRWRTWLTRHFVADWLSARTFYHLQIEHQGTDNPDQRIAEDIRDFTTSTLSLGLDLMNSVVTLVSFLAVLWGLSGPLTIPLGDMSVTIPGYMVWVALGYAVIGSWVMHKIGRPLIAINFNRQKAEADFRFGLVRVRENAEGIALYGGETVEEASLRQRFGAVVANWRTLMTRTKYVTGVSSGYSQIAIIFPFFAAGGRYLSGAITLGTLMQISSAFGQVQSALSWFVDSYTLIAAWKATVDRLIGFRNSVERHRAEQAVPARLKVIQGDEQALAAWGVDLALPDGRPLQEGMSLSVAPGDRILVTGPSGSGKSTLFRALAGIWPFAKGTVRVPKGTRSLFLPQKPYLPIGTLRAALSYPASADAYNDEAIRSALEASELGSLLARLDEEGHWQQSLSPGEQQRLAIARALLYRPDWLFLDEATSALGPEIEARLYAMLKQRLPEAAIVSIAHRPELAAMHDRTVEVPAALESAEVVPA